MTKPELTISVRRWLLMLTLTLILSRCTLAPDARAAEAPNPPPQTPALSSADDLLYLAERAGFKVLTDCEQNLLQSAPKGEYADCRSADDKQNDPSKGDQWPASRQIRAELIRWLCVNEAARKLFDPKGIQVYGAKVIDSLDLSFISVPFPVVFVRSRFLKPMSLMEASIESLYLPGTWTGPINAERLTTRGPIFLTRGFHAYGEVRLLGAIVGGDLDCANGNLPTPIVER